MDKKHLITKNEINNIKQEHLPLIVFSDAVKTFLSYAIKHHTKGVYNHVMVMHKPGFVVTQNLDGFQELPIRVYMNGDHHLKLVSPLGWDVYKVQKAITFKLCAANKVKKYDFLGILGQLLGIAWLQSDKKEYCSETVIRFMQVGGVEYPNKHDNPSAVNKWMKQHKNLFKVYGYYVADEEM